MHNFQVWFKNRRAKYRKLKGSQETEDREAEERHTETKMTESNDDEADPAKATEDEGPSHPPTKRQRTESDSEERITIPTPFSPLSSAYIPRSFPFDPRLSSGYGAPYVRDWAVYYDGLNYRPCPMTIQQMYSSIGVIH